MRGAATTREPSASARFHLLVTSLSEIGRLSSASLASTKSGARVIARASLVRRLTRRDYQNGDGDERRDDQNHEDSDKNAAPISLLWCDGGQFLQSVEIMSAKRRRTTVDAHNSACTLDLPFCRRVYSPTPPQNPHYSVANPASIRQKIETYFVRATLEKAEILSTRALLF